MTRDQLVARAQAFIDLKYVARSDARQKAMGLSYIEAERQDIAREIAAFADAIFAEMAGEWNAVERLARAVEAFIADADKDPAPAHCPDPPWLKEFRSAIRALRRPDAAPGRPATPSVEEVARAIYETEPFYEAGEYVDGFPVSPGGNLSWEQACSRDAEFAGDKIMLPITKFARDAAAAVLALFAEERS